MNPQKASADDFAGRFREIVSDPLNLLIERHPMAGVTADGLVHLHNGIRVPATGPQRYFGDFSSILQINRGVHEPLEEYVFQRLLKILPERLTSLELGAYWGHYSMWLKQVKPQANVILLEPDAERLEVGVSNFRRQQYPAEFIQAWVGNGEGQFAVDAFLASRPGLTLDVLHADIDLYEVEMLQGAAQALAEQSIGYFLISTHSQALHEEVVQRLAAARYRVEVSSDFDRETTSFDGFVLASSPGRPALFRKPLRFLGRTALAGSSAQQLLASLVDISRS